VCLAALFAAGIAPAAIAATEPSPPITVSDCRGGIASLELIEVAAYDVTFRNTAAVTADDVRLSIPYGRNGKRVSFDLHGTFAPGIDVARALRKTVGAGLYSYEKTANDCRVEYVHFIDGTSWTPAS
jgi:hypothetical protein